MALLFILLVIAGGMGLSVEAGLLGPLASQVGSVGNHEHLWDWRSVNLFLMLFFSPRSSPSFFSLPGWQLTGGLLGGGVRGDLDCGDAGDWYCHDHDRHPGGSGGEKPGDRPLRVIRQPTAQNRSAARHGADVDYGGVTAGGSGLRREMDTIVIILALCGGALLSVQAAINGRLGSQVGVLRSAFFNLRHRRAGDGIADPVFCSSDVGKPATGA